MRVRSHDEARRAARSFRDRVTSDARADDTRRSGDVAAGRRRRRLLPAAAREVADVTGAGDTVIATMALALAAGATLTEAARLANEAAGIVVGRFGPAYGDVRGTAHRARDHCRRPDSPGRCLRHLRPGPPREPAACAFQCRKCRRPVKTIARPCSSAAAITSSSCTDPPGWTTAVAPAAATASRPSRNGKNASDAATDPLQHVRAGRAGLHPRHVHRIDAAHLTRADRQRAVGAGEDHGVRLHVRADPPREAQRLPLLGGRLPLRHHAQIAVTATAPRPRLTRSRACTSTAPRIDRSSTSPASAAELPRSRRSTTRMFGLRRQDRRAPRRRPTARSPPR